MIERIYLSVPELGTRRSATPDEVLAEFRRLSSHSRETLEFHMPREQETQMLRLVQDGDPEGLAGWFHARSEGLPLGKLSENELQQAKCLFVGAVALYTRAAMEGGLEEELAHNLCDAYVHIASAVTAPARLRELMVLAGIDFARRVETTHRSGVPAIRTCRAYIHNHLHYKITLAELAEACALSPNYLSTLFREQMGIGLKEYILREKLDGASRVLLASDRPVSAVAAQFSFASHSSFSAHFKRRFGVSPAMYRLQKQP